MTVKSHHLKYHIGQRLVKISNWCKNQTCTTCGSGDNKDCHSVAVHTKGPLKHSIKAVNNHVYPHMYAQSINT